ncbi:CoA-binding protein [Solwaraspora sp. WMMD406]|uniref:CoA-binding protein n=1 Tax=Solwaraspora sp. WMMD406 TaxID=3016095 RepID=UPI00241780AA|nr:CoA-binding protein [Solwaraspora sp. WMMD406]MDG4768123.1 CoA-binding protein [Solwaraspora sp. WMMD406]
MRTPQQILSEARTIAVVGASRDPAKPAHAVPAQLISHGWRVIPVNPYVDMIFGTRSYPSLADLPEAVDLVNVFRPVPEAIEVVRAAVAIGTPAVWLQSGIASTEAREIATAAGLDYVEDHCIAVERALGGLSA